MLKKATANTGPTLCCKMPTQESAHKANLKLPQNNTKQKHFSKMQKKIKIKKKEIKPN